RFNSRLHIRAKEIRIRTYGGTGDIPSGSIYQSIYGSKMIQNLFLSCSYRILIHHIGDYRNRFPSYFLYSFYSFFGPLEITSHDSYFGSVLGHCSDEKLTYTSGAAGNYYYFIF